MGICKCKGCDDDCSCVDAVSTAPVLQALKISMRALTLSDVYQTRAGLVAAIAAACKGSNATPYFVQRTDEAQNALPVFLQEVQDLSDEDRSEVSYATMVSVGIVLRHADGTRVPGPLDLIWSPHFSPGCLWAANDNGVGLIDAGDSETLFDALGGTLLFGKFGNNTMYCAQCGKTDDGGLRKCQRCHGVRYCSKECQTKHWKAKHRKDCPTMAAEYNRLNAHC